MMKNALLATAAAVLVAAPAIAQDAPRRGGTLTIAINADIRSLEPGINRDGNTDSVAHMIYEGLVGYRTDLSVGPQLAKGWTVSDDGRTFRFTLRDGAKFHNGQPVTAADVKSSWDRQIANKAWPCARFFNGASGAKVEAVEAPDAKTVVYRLDKPSALFLKQLANFQCAVVAIHPAAFDAEGKWKEAIGTGPFKLKEWKRGEYVAMERVADYVPNPEPASGYAGARNAYVDNLVVRVVPDASAAEAALVSGAVDVLPDVDAHRIEGLKQKGMTVQTTPGLGWSALLMQTRDPLLSNPKIRRAIAHALNLQDIADARMLGLSKGNPSAVADPTPYFQPSFVSSWPAYDPARAKALLKEAGYKGETIRIQTNKRYTGMYDNAVVVQAMLQAAGMKAELDVMEWATQLDAYLKGAFQIQSFSYSARFDPGLMYSALIGDKDKLKWAQWEDPKAIALLAEANGSLDEARRKAIFVELHRMATEQVPVIGLYFSTEIEATAPTVRGYKPWPAGKPLPWGVWKAG
ncbi:peptide ABC transporter substrate-binding protein [Allostella sp. ATCC 35155]|nr:peptide ABC transporter substrate-binding protein [Stella sp. ATCC 35155]